MKKFLFTGLTAIVIATTAIFAKTPEPADAQWCYYGIVSYEVRWFYSLTEGKYVQYYKPVYNWTCWF